jgi:hypothetical protein
MNDTASTETVDPKKHARLGPSSSDIWLTCLGAPAEWDKYPPRIPGFAAREGTLAHALCEAALQIQDIPWKADMKFNVEGTEIVVTDEMLNAVGVYAATVMKLADIADWQVVEKQLSFSWLWKNPPKENIFGTIDYAAFVKDTIYILDFKYGRGKAVDVEANPQLLIYALAAFGELRRVRPDLAQKVEWVCLAIVQPRAGGQPVRQWPIRLGDLFYWAYTTLVPTIDKILAGGPLPLVAGAHCYFCAASFECPVYRKQKRQTSIDSFPDWNPENEKIN